MLVQLLRLYHLFISAPYSRVVACGICNIFSCQTTSLATVQFRLKPDKDEVKLEIEGSELV